MVVGVVHVLVVGIVVGEPSEGFLAQREIVELVLEDDTTVVQPVFDDGIAGRYLLLGEGNLGKVVLPLVRVVLRLRGDFAEGVSLLLCVEDRVTLLVGEVGDGVVAEVRHHRFIDALPVVDILTLTPLPLESLFTLSDGNGIIEIPC